MTTQRSTPKYQVIRDALLTWIQSGELLPGDKLPIESELADRFSVSRQTVRQAVGELVQQGILERKQGSGTYYKDAAGTSPPRTKTGIVGVITTYISDYIFPDIIRGIVERLSTDNFSPLLYSTQNDLNIERRALEDVLMKDVDAIIVEASRGAFPNTNLDLYHALQDRGIPIVMLHARYPGLEVPLVEVNDAKGAYTAVCHLIDQGHSRIGALVKLDDLQGLRRVEGITSALGEHFLTFRAEYMSFYTTEEQPVVSSQYADRIANLRPCERPTAVFCYNDAMATALLNDLRERGITVPDQISLIGFDDAPVASHGYPQLTTMAHPKYAMGVHVANLVVQCLRDEHPTPRVYTYTPELIVRASTAPVHAMTPEVD